MALHGKKFAGDLYGRPYGSAMAFSNMGNVSELTTTKEMDTDELTSTGRDDYGEAIEIESIPGSTEMSIKFNTFDKAGMARALMGTAIDLSTVPVTITDMPLTVGMDWLKLAYKDIDPTTFVLTDSSSVVIPSSTYTLNPRIGMIKFNDTSVLLPAAEVTYSGTTKGSSGYQIDANTLASLPLELYLDGKDRITGKNGILEVPHAVMASEGDINWLSEDFWENGLTGKLVKDEGKSTMLFTEFV